MKCYHSTWTVKAASVGAFLDRTDSRCIAEFRSAEWVSSRSIILNNSARDRVCILSIALWFARIKPCSGHCLFKTFSQPSGAMVSFLLGASCPPDRSWMTYCETVLEKYPAAVVCIRCRIVTVGVPSGQCSIRPAPVENGAPRDGRPRGYARWRAGDETGRAAWRQLTANLSLHSRVR